MSLRVRPSVADARLAVLGVLAAVLLAGCEQLSPSAETTDIAGLAPFNAGDEQRYVLTDGDGEVVGSGTLSVRQEGERYFLEQAFVEADPPEGGEPSTDETTVEVDAVTLKPIAGSRRIESRESDGSPRLESFEWRYLTEGDEVILQVSRDIDGETSESTLDVRDHYYDNETALWLWRTLAFQLDYDEHYVSVNPIEVSQQTVRVTMPQREEVTVPAGTFETWRILVRSGRAVRTAWIDVEEPHHLVRWDNGSTVFELESATP